MSDPNRPKSHLDTTELMVVLAAFAFLVEIGWSVQAVFGLLVLLLALVALMSGGES